MKFKVGDKVRYTSNQWGDTSVNPLWGGRYGNVEGVISYVDAEGYRVDWENGKYHIRYYEEDLELVTCVPDDLFTM